MIRQAVEQIIATAAGLKPQIERGDVIYLNINKSGEIDIMINNEHAFLAAFPEATTEAHDNQYVQHQVRQYRNGWTIRVFALEEK